MDRNRILELAIEALEKQKAGIDEEIVAIQAELKGTGAAIRQTTSPVTRRGRTRTAAERKAQAQRMREYWAEKRALAAKSRVAMNTSPVSGKGRRKSTAEKKALSLKMKQVWARRRAEGAKKAKTK